MEHNREPRNKFTYTWSIQFGSVAQLCPTLWPHGLQHARLSCPSPTPRAWSNSCPSSWWGHPTISSSAVPFSSCPQSFSASGSFQMSQFFASGGQTWSFSFSISPSNEYWGLISFRMNWFDLLAVQGTLKSLLQHHSSKASFLQQHHHTTVQKHQFNTQLSLWSNSHIHTWLLEKNIAVTIWTFVSKVMFLLFNMLSRFVIAFLPRSKCLLISWLQSISLNQKSQYTMGERTVSSVNGVRRTGQPHAKEWN